MDYTDYRKSQNLIIKTVLIREICGKLCLSLNH